MRIILGSSSKWRRKLWERHFGTQESGAFLSPDIDEKALRHEDAETLTLLIANAKADALVKRLLEEQGGRQPQGRTAPAPVDRLGRPTFWAGACG